MLFVVSKSLGVSMCQIYEVEDGTFQTITIGVFDFRNMCIQKVETSHYTSEISRSDFITRNLNELISYFKLFCTSDHIPKSSGDFYIYNNSLLGCTIWNIDDNNISYDLWLNSIPKRWTKTNNRTFSKRNKRLSRDEMLEVMDKFLSNRLKVFERIIDKNLNDLIKIVLDEF